MHQVNTIERFAQSVLKLAVAVGTFAAFAPGILLAAPSEELLAGWSFEQVQNGKTSDRVTQVEDTIGGHYQQTPGVVGKALQFDGFTTEIIRPAASAPRLPDSFTLEAWVALGAYPWNWCPLIEQSSGTNAGYSLAIGPRGQLRLGLASGGQWRECVSKDFILPLRQWTHVTATFERGKGLTVYANGESAGHVDVSGAITPAPGADLRIGVIPAPTRHWSTWPWWCGTGDLRERRCKSTANRFPAARSSVTAIAMNWRVPRS